ncbi:MAG: protein-tyrosine-phosphatase [Saprospiraceae bacterium]
MDDNFELFIQDRIGELDSISTNRKQDLNILAEIICSPLQNSARSNIIIICTHNSRRSQIAEFLLRLTAHHLKIDGIHVYSGGTEATALNYRIVSAFECFGFRFTVDDNLNNPGYIYITDISPLKQTMFSKTYDHDVNPQKNFIAIMVCNDADKNCPIVVGASDKLSLPYLDPKTADNTAMESMTYNEKVEEIGREMLYLCLKVKEVLN